MLQQLLYDSRHTQAASLPVTEPTMQIPVGDTANSHVALRGGYCTFVTPAAISCQYATSSACQAQQHTTRLSRHSAP